MKKFKFLHCGDIHLDARLTNTDSIQKGSEIRREEIKETFSKTIDIVQNKDIDALFICGDLFEHEYISKNTLNYLINEFNRISNVNIFIAPGNHDPYSKNSYYSLLEWPQNVHIFYDQNNRVYLKDHDISIYGLGFNQKYMYNSLIPTIKEQVQKESSSTKRILLTHGTLNPGSQSCEYHPIKLHEIVDIGFEYVALGHFHQYRFIGDNIAYCGSPEPLGFDETGDHGIITGCLKENIVETEFIPICKRKYIVKRIDCSDMSAVESIESCIKEAVEVNTNNLLRIILEGKLDRAIELDYLTFKYKYTDECFLLDIINNTQPAFDISSIKLEKNLRGVFVNKILHQIENEKDENVKRKLNKAMIIGLEALED